jgi:hypothetical protein
MEDLYKYAGKDFQKKYNIVDEKSKISIIENILTTK